jgi:hypothetical protein
MSEVWLSESNFNGSTSVILLGDVSLEILDLLSKEYPLGVLWICSEKNNLEHPPNTTLINSSSDSEKLSKIFSDFILLNYSCVPSVKVSKAISNDSSHDYARILELVISQINSAMRARKTRSENGYIRQNQVFKNLAGYLSNRLPDDCSSIGNGALGVVVGAGPSLDKTLPLLKEGLHRPLIVAADSTLFALKNAGINPDFVVSIDPEKSFESCSISGYTPGVAILSSQSHPSWTKQWGNNCCFLSGRVVTEDWLAEKGISKTKLLAVNNAGLTALAFAEFLNTAAILTVGMDLAGGNQGEQRYAENTNRSHIQTFSSHFHKIPGNYQDTVLSPFLSDWEETSNYCQKISLSKMVINLNDRGAKLAGATLIHPDQVDELKKALLENLSPFNAENNNLLSSTKSLKGQGLNQLLCTLAKHCDDCWLDFDKLDTENKFSMINFLRARLANKDFASLMGDFAFATIPTITSEKQPSDGELKSMCLELQHLIWKLEDAIVETEPNEEFLIRFFTEKFT